MVRTGQNWAGLFGTNGDSQGRSGKAMTGVVMTGWDRSDQTKTGQGGSGRIRTGQDRLGRVLKTSSGGGSLVFRGE